MVVEATSTSEEDNVAFGAALHANHLPTNFKHFGERKGHSPPSQLPLCMPCAHSLLLRHMALKGEVRFLDHFELLLD